jgi:hypothetical protein
MGQVSHLLGRSSLPLPGDVKLGGEASSTLVGKKVLALNSFTLDQSGISSATLSQGAVGDADKGSRSHTGDGERMVMKTDEEGSLWRLGKESKAAQVGFGPAGALQDVSDGFRAERVVEVMIHKQHAASIRVLVDMVGAAGFSAAEALVFDGPDPFPGSAVG